MAGHSKWANIKHRKMIKDTRKGQAYAKLVREVMMAAKIGGPNPEGNFRLRTAIDKAKSAGIPNDTIERGIAKGSGQLSAEAMETLHYEGYGPGGVAIYVQAMTDNRNRTAGDIRSYFSKYGGNLGETGCVGWMFEEFGFIEVDANASQEDALLEAALDCGADDLLYNDETQLFEIKCNPDALNTLCTALQQQGYSIRSAQSTRVAQNTVQVSTAEVAKPLLKLLDILEDHDDVQNVYANFDMDESLLTSCSPA